MEACDGGGLFCRKQLNLKNVRKTGWRRLTQTFFQGEWTKKTAGGCRNNPTCVDNPQYLLTVTKDVNLHALLVVHMPPQSDCPHIGCYVIKTRMTGLPLPLPLQFLHPHLFISDFCLIKIHLQ